MLLKEDGHLDIEKVKQLNEEDFRKEKRTWGNNELLAWERSQGTVSLERFAEIYHQKIRDLWHEDE